MAVAKALLTSLASVERTNASMCGLKLKGEHDMDAVTRDYHGFRQYSEDNGKTWLFSIVGFDYLGRNDRCSVLLYEGGKTGVPIDDRDRILINGIWWSREHWNH
jgi:hypothetical protein